MVGVLNGGAGMDGQYYVWVESGGVRTHVRWPAGFGARLDPLEVVDRDGQVMAREGDVIQVAGGAGTADAAVVEAIGASQVFVAHSLPVVLRSQQHPDS